MLKRKIEEQLEAWYQNPDKRHFAFMEPGRSGRLQA